MICDRQTFIIYLTVHHLVLCSLQPFQVSKTGLCEYKKGLLWSFKTYQIVLLLYCLWLWCCKLIFLCVFLCSFVLFYILCNSVYYIRGDLEGCSFWSLLGKNGSNKFDITYNLQCLAETERRSYESLAGECERILFWSQRGSALIVSNENKNTLKSRGITHADRHINFCGK